MSSFVLGLEKNKPLQILPTLEEALRGRKTLRVHHIAAIDAEVMEERYNDDNRIQKSLTPNTPLKTGWQPKICTPVKWVPCLAVLRFQSQSHKKKYRDTGIKKKKP
ncbi:hypothetical protein IFM46972_07323 [Aspergillus udagawae]|uniref:Uncharacterized protein n=1 Tax=Aspergillus udagawae TaxID=91492 RepID=A0A8H3P243_9EURO|nr:hypothetical protein IFM46972_07323 [Aspergillus udagawae]